MIWVAAIDRLPAPGSKILMRREAHTMGFAHSLVMGSFRPEYQCPWRDEGNDAVTDSGAMPTHWADLNSVYYVLGLT